MDSLPSFGDAEQVVSIHSDVRNKETRRDDGSREETEMDSTQAKQQQQDETNQPQPLQSQSRDEEKEETSSVASYNSARSPTSPAPGQSPAAARVAAARARSRSLTSSAHTKGKGASGSATLRPSRTSIGASVPSSGYGTTYSPAPAAATPASAGLPSAASLPTKYVGMQTGGRIEYLLPTRVPVASRATAASAAQRNVKSPKADRLYRGFIAPGQHAPFDLRLKHPTVLGSTVTEPAGPPPPPLPGSKSAAYDDSKAARISVTDTTTRLSSEKRVASARSPAALAAVLEEDIAARREARVQKLEAEAERVKEALWAASNEVERAQMIDDERRFVADLRNKVRAARRAREEAWKRQEIAQRRKENASLRAPEERLRKYEALWARDQPAVAAASEAGDERPLTPEQEADEEEKQQDGIPRTGSKQPRTRLTVQQRGRPVDRWHGSGGVEFPILSADDPDSMAPLWTAHAEAPQTVPVAAAPATAAPSAALSLGSLTMVPMDSSAASSFSPTGHRGTTSVGGADQLDDAGALSHGGDDLSADFAAAASSPAAPALPNDDSGAANPDAGAGFDGVGVDATADLASDTAPSSSATHQREPSGAAPDAAVADAAEELPPSAQDAAAIDSGEEQPLADGDAAELQADEPAPAAQLIRGDSGHHSRHNTARSVDIEQEAGSAAAAASAPPADSSPEADPAAEQNADEQPIDDADAAAAADPADADADAEADAQHPVDENAQYDENEAAWAEAEAEFDADMARLSSGIVATKLPRKTGLFAAKPKQVSLVVVPTSSSGSRASGPSWLLHWNSKSKSKEEDMLNLSSMRDCVRGIEAGAFANNKDFAKKYASVESNCFSLTLADRSLDVVVAEADDAELFARVLARILDPSDAFRVPRAVEPSSSPPL